MRKFKRIIFLPFIFLVQNENSQKYVLLTTSEALKFHVAEFVPFLSADFFYNKNLKSIPSYKINSRKISTAEKFLAFHAVLRNRRRRKRYSYEVY